jgi:hypothetical protein
MARSAKRKHIIHPRETTKAASPEQNLAKTLSRQSNSKKVRKLAQVYSTPEDRALEYLYQDSGVKIHAAKQKGEPLPARLGKNYDLKKYDPQKGFQIPEGPLLPKRKGRPHGAFYSEQADKEGYENVVNNTDLEVTAKTRRAKKKDEPTVTAKKQAEHRANSKKLYKQAKIYATPEDQALYQMYDVSTDRRSKERAFGFPLSPIQGRPYRLSDYDPTRGGTIPEGPLLPPRTGRPHGAFYSKQADKEGYEIVARNLEQSSQFGGIAPETGIGTEWARPFAPKTEAPNANNVRWTVNNA